MGLDVPNFLYRFSYFGPWNHCEMNCFTGLVLLTLAVFALWYRKEIRHRRQIVFFAVLAGLSVFLALGRYNPAYKIFFYLLLLFVQPSL